MKFSTAVTNHLILFSSLSLLTQINYLLKITQNKRKKKRKKRKEKKSLRTLKNHYSIDKVPPKLLIETMSPSNYQNIVNVSPKANKRQK
jgi:hypothetical protein